MMKSLKHAEFISDISVLNIKELFLYEAEGILLVCLFGYFFYRSLLITIIGLPISVLFLIYKAKETSEKLRHKMKEEFKETLVSVNGSLKAGYSLENAFIEAEREMTGFYGEKSLMVKELRNIKKGLSNGKVLPVLLYETGKRNGIEEISEFSSILIIGKQTGGNINEIIETFIHVAEDKIQVEQEIDTIISAKKYEQKIMNCIPFFIIFYIEITNRGFFNVLYNNFVGRIIMTFCLVIYLLSIYMAGRITAISI